MACCLTIRPQYVIQFNYGESRAWSPYARAGQVFNGATWYSDWNTAFATLNNLIAFPAELKAECYATGGESFVFHADYQDDINCLRVNPYNQAVQIRLRLTVCNPLSLKFIAAGLVERKDLHFDWIKVSLWPWGDYGGELTPNAWNTILYEHGTNENINCEMASKECCADVLLMPGLYELDIETATGDGLHHDDCNWNLTMGVDCTDAYEQCSSETECESDDPPTPPRPPGDGDLPEEGEPPPGQQGPGPDNPDPVPRGLCSCDNCELQAIGVIIAGLVGSECEDEGLCSTTTSESLAGAINGGYVLSWDEIAGEWNQLLGTFGDHDDPGILIARQKLDCHNSDLGCFWHGVPEQTGICNEAEVYLWKITGTLNCDICEVDEEVNGAEWSGGLTFHLQCRSRNPLAAAPADEWGWATDCSSYWFACMNLGFDQLVEQPCNAPASCFGYVLYSNGANLVLDELCDCVVDSSTATAKLIPIGLSTLCA